MNPDYTQDEVVKAFASWAYRNKLFLKVEESILPNGKVAFPPEFRVRLGSKEGECKVRFHSQSGDKFSIDGSTPDEAIFRMALHMNGLCIERLVPQGVLLTKFELDEKNPIQSLCRWVARNQLSIYTSYYELFHPGDKTWVCIKNYAEEEPAEFKECGNTVEEAMLNLAQLVAALSKRWFDTSSVASWSRQSLTEEMVHFILDDEVTRYRNMQPKSTNATN